MGKGKELLPLPLSIEVTKALKGLGKKKQLIPACPLGKHIVQIAWPLLTRLS